MFDIFMMHSVYFYEISRIWNTQNDDDDNIFIKYFSIEFTIEIDPNDVMGILFFGDVLFT